MRSIIVKPPEPKAVWMFEAQRACDGGAIVIDSASGREMTMAMPSFNAKAVADELNLAAARGRKALAKALGAL